jgi:hypothetical protein
MIFLREGSAANRARNAYALVAVRWDRRGDCLGKTQFCARRSQVRGDPFRHADEFCSGLPFIAGSVFQCGNLPFTSRLPVMRPSATVMSFSRRCGGPWDQWKASSVC